MVLKTITLQEANGLLPLVKEHFFHLNVLLARLQQLRARFDKRLKERMVIDQSYDDIRLVTKENSGRRSRRTLRQITALENMIELELTALMRLGAVVKGLFPPHIDFFSIVDGRPVLLCWHAGEKEISHWHHLDDGTPQRRAIAQKASFGPEVVH